MKKAIVASILAFCPLTAFAQTSADSIPRMFSQMKGISSARHIYFDALFPYRPEAESGK